MIPGELFASISPYLISEERWNIMKLRPSQRRTRDPEQICCIIRTNTKNWWSNFSSSFRVVGLKLTELFRFSLPNQLFSSISFVPLHRKCNGIASIVFFALSLCLLPLDYILCNNGPKTLPCGTPDTTLTSLLRQPSTITCCYLFDWICITLQYWSILMKNWSREFTY